MFRWVAHKREFVVKIKSNNFNAIKFFLTIQA